MNGIQDDTLLQELVRDTIHRWRSGEQPDADGLLKRHPELAENKSLAIDLIYEEYCLRHEQGDTLVPSTFCERFPHYEQSLSKMLDVHETLEQGKPAKSPWPQVGDSFHGYELVEALGRGSLARVFLARETAVGKRLVVVKISRHGAGEAHLLGKAAHPGIVPILSVTHDESTGWTVICMPLLGTATGTELLKSAFTDGRTPSSASVIARVAAQPLPEGVSVERAAEPAALAWRGTYFDGVARLGLLLAEGLAAAHGVGIMHRDIKPSNVLLSWSGQPMLLDFNLSTEGGPQAERVAGTLAYMAPELMDAMQTSQGRPAQPFDPRADIFSLGALLYQLLTNRLPAKPDNAEQLAPGNAGPWLAARRQGVVPPRQIEPQIDPGLERIVLRCLAICPDERYVSARELSAAFRDYLGWRPRGWRALRHRRRELLLAALGLGVLAFAGGRFVSRLPPREERLFMRGRRQYDEGKYAAAAASWGECLSIRSDWPEAHFARGQALRMAGKPDQARPEFLALSDDDPATAHAFAGYCSLLMNNTPAAEADYTIAIHHGANDAVSWNNFGHCQRRSNKIEQAIQSFDTAISADPELAVAYCNRAVARFRAQIRAGEPISDETRADILEACRLEERSDYCFHAGTIFAKTSGSNPNHHGEAVAKLQRAYELGYPRSSQSGIDPPELVNELPFDLQGPTSKGETTPPPGFASPPETADLGGVRSS